MAPQHGLIARQLSPFNVRLGEASEKALARGAAQSQPQVAIPGQCPHGRGEGGGVARRHQQTFDAVAYEMAVAWDVRNDQGAGAGSRLQQCPR